MEQKPKTSQILSVIKISEKESRQKKGKKKHINKKERKNEAHTTHAKTRAMAKAGPPDPSWKAIATAKAETVAE